MNVFELVATLKLDSEDYERGLQAAENTASKFSTKLKRGIGVMAKATAAAVGAAAAGAAALTKQAVSAYANYEQLVGGVETLFGAKGATSVQEYADMVGKAVDEVGDEFTLLMEAQDLALENASNAYETAGMSANDYMQTMTSFAASLKQSTSDNVEAAQVADMAMRDMSDNANKMGTSMESIQNAYQGFAKQNYMMLDNLKLGYGGTKTEMERLLADAEKIHEETTGEVTHYDINNLADVYNAIHDVQENLGITGTTAKEAMHTIEGSAKMTKAAWQNVLTAMAGGGDLEKAFDGLITGIFGREGDAGSGLLNQIIPTVEKALSGIGTVIEKLAPQIQSNLPSLLTTVLPALVTAATALVESFIKVLPDLLGTIIPAAITAITDTLPTLIAALPEMLTKIVTALVDAIPIILDAIPEIISAVKEALSNVDFAALGKQIMESLGKALEGNGGLILGAITAIFGGKLLKASISKGFGSLLGGLGKSGGGLKSLGSSLAASGPAVLEFSVAILAVATAIRIVGPYLDELGEAIARIVESVGTAVSQIIANITPLVDVIMSNMAIIIATIGEALPPIIDSVTNGITSIVDSVTTGVSSIIDSISGLAESVGSSIATINESIGDTFTALGDAISGIIDSISNGLSKVLDSVAGIIDSFGEAALNAGNGVAVMADAIIRLTNETGAVDLGATLAAVATGITSIKSSSENLGGAAENLNTLSDALKGVGNAIRAVKKELTTAWPLKQIESTMQAAITVIEEQVNKLKAIFENTTFKFNQNIALPHFSMSGTFNAETGEVPSVSVKWYRSAYEMGAYFNSPALIGVGDAARPELLVGKDVLFNDISKAVAEVTPASNQVINVYIDGIKYNTDEYIDASVVDFVETMVRKNKMYART